MRAAIFAILMAGLAACAPVSAPSTTPKTDPIPFQLDPRGVQLVGRAQRSEFGRTDHSAELAMTKLVGEPAVSRAICSDGSPFVTWPDGSSLYFQRGEFRGWSKRSADGSVRTGGSTCA